MPAENGRFSAEVKPPGGKLLRCTLSVDRSAIIDIKFTGDFFMIPGEAVQELERQIIGCPLEIETIRRTVETFFTGAIEVAGVMPGDFVDIIASILDRYTTSYG